MWASSDYFIAALLGGIVAALAGDFFRRLMDMGFALVAILGQACGGALVAVGQACGQARTRKK